MARIAYIRVSTQEQNTARQEQSFAQGVDKVFIEKISGKDTNRPQLQAMLEYVREGDTVIVESFSRLARNARDLLNIVDELTAKGCDFVSLKESVDTSTPQGKFMLTVFAGLIQLEREQILQRQAEGIAIAKADGKYKGRQPIAIDESTFRKEVTKWRAGEQTATATMAKLGLKANTFYRRVKELGL